MTPQQREIADSYEEPDDTKLRNQLELRPIFYPEIDDWPHPDRAECPAWCWILQCAAEGNHYTHGVDIDHPMTATHTMEPSPTIVASLYRAGGDSDGNRRYTLPATIDVRASAIGTGPPVITLHLRRRDHDAAELRYEEALRLSVDDTRELMAALRWVVDQVDPPV